MANSSASDCDLDDIVQSLSKAIVGRKIGRPVVVRMHAYIADNSTSLETTANRICDQVSNLFQSPALTWEEQRAAQPTHLTRMGKYRDGETLLLSCTLITDPRPRYDILVIGSQGTICFEDQGFEVH